MTINIIECITKYPTQKLLYPFIVQVGTGGTGGYLVQHIAQMLGTSQIPASYVVADPDIIEKKNLGNQLFLDDEVGLRKADVLASRYSAAYGIDIASYSESYIESPEHLMQLFSKEYLTIENRMHHHVAVLPILISCVDNNYSRQIFHQFFENVPQCIYIDAGNESTAMPADWQERSKTAWTDEELQTYKASGWTGQVVTGVKLPGFRQDPVAVVLPDILTDDDEISPSEMSCSDLSASEPQRLIVNKFAALAILSVLTEIVEDNTLSTHIINFHAKRGYMRSKLVEVNEEPAF